MTLGSGRRTKNSSDQPPTLTAPIFPGKRILAMKAVVLHEHGGPEVLRYEDFPDPVPRCGQVLVRIKAVALNRLDLWVRKGLPNLRLEYPHILGADIAGVVEAVGDGVAGVEAMKALRLRGGERDDGQGVRRGAREGGVGAAAARRRSRRRARCSTRLATMASRAARGHVASRASERWSPDWRRWDVVFMLSWLVGQGRMSMLRLAADTDQAMERPS